MVAARGCSFVGFAAREGGRQRGNTMHANSTRTLNALQLADAVAEGGAQQAEVGAERHEARALGEHLATRAW